jgi:anti-sigma factor (TIGR02949 family)
MKDVDCQDLLQRLWAYLDGEADEELCDDFRAHIEKCLPCKQHADFEVKLRQIIQAKCRGERAPEHLRLNLARMLGWTLLLVLTVLVSWSVIAGWSF